MGDVNGGAQAAIGSLGRNNGTTASIQNKKASVFDEYKNIPAESDNKILIYQVTADGAKKGLVIFVAEKDAKIDQQVIIRGIMKAQNIVVATN